MHRLLLVSCLFVPVTALADSYGLATAGPEPKNISQPVATSGYGLIPSNAERQGVSRPDRTRSPVVYSQPEPRKYPQPVIQAVSQTPVAVPEPLIVAAPAAGRYSSAPVVASRYQSAEVVSRKQYTVAVNGSRQLSDVMRAPVAFASEPQQQLRSLQSLKSTDQPVAKVASLDKLRASMSLPPAAQPAASSTSKLNGLQPASLDKLKTLVNKPAVAAAPASASAASALNKPASLDKLKAMVKKTAPAAAQVAPAEPETAVPPQLAALKQKLTSQKKTSATKAEKAPVKAAVALPVVVSEPVVVKGKPPKEDNDNTVFGDVVETVLGVEPVKSWEKSQLAKQEMKKGGAIPSLMKFSQKVFISKEASRGGQGVAGGGCGCN